MTNKFSSLMVGGGGRQGSNIKPLSKHNSRFKQISAFVTTLLIPSIAFAGGGTGLTKVDGFFTTLNGWLIGAGGLVLTIALSVAGYKVMWGGQTIREVSPIMLGAIIIGGGPMIAGMLL